MWKYFCRQGALGPQEKDLLDKQALHPFPVPFLQSNENSIQFPVFIYIHFLTADDLETTMNNHNLTGGQENPAGAPLQ